MLSFFRKFSKSPFGVAIFALILIAFVVTLYEGKSGMNMFQGDAGAAVATVGGHAIGEAELVRRVQNQLDGERQQNPGITMADFVARGGVEKTVQLTTTGRALELFAASQGMVASRKLVDGAIASIPQFFGPTGQFDRTTFLNALATRKVSEKMLREDFAREALTRELVTSVAGGAAVPATLVQPYASLLLETRVGRILDVPSAAFPGVAAPTDAEVQTYYQRHAARYTLPERRLMRFAVFDKSRFATITATDAEITKYYNDNAAMYAAREKRGFTQIIVPTESEAKSIVAKIQSGAPMAAAAKSAGRDAIVVPVGDEASFAKLSGPQVARAAFAAPKGAVAPVAQSGLGYHVVRVDAVVVTPATTLASARPVIAIALGASKQTKAMAQMVADIEDAVGNKASFDDIARKYALSVTTTPPLTAAGKAIDTPGYVPSPDVGVVLTDAFQAESGDQPAVATLPGTNRYAVWKLDRVIAAAPRPLAEVRDQVIADVHMNAAARAARSAAERIVAAVNSGTPFDQAVSALGVRLPPGQQVRARRIDIARAEGKVPPPVALLFAMAPQRARILEQSDNRGWYVVRVDAVEPGDARLAPGLIQATQEQLGGAIGDEYVQQFAQAVAQNVGVTKDTAAILRLKASLLGGGGQ